MSSMPLSVNCNQIATALKFVSLMCCLICAGCEASQPKQFAEFQPTEEDLLDSTQSMSFIPPITTKEVEVSVTPVQLAAYDMVMSREDANKWSPEVGLQVLKDGAVVASGFKTIEHTSVPEYGGLKPGLADNSYPTRRCWIETYNGTPTSVRFVPGTPGAFSIKLSVPKGCKRWEVVCMQ